MRDPTAVGAALLNELEAIKQDVKSKPWNGNPTQPTLRAADLLPRYEIPDFIDADPIVKYGRPQDRPEGV